MTESSFSSRHAIGKVAERQMQRWALGLEIKGRAEQSPDPEALTVFTTFRRVRE